MNPDLRPTDRAPIVRLSKGGERECVLARWGLVPFWAKELKFGNRCINARAETAATAPAFRAAYKARRCLVPVNAFYEWTGEKGSKVKWRISVPEEPLFALAGLWEWWRDPLEKDQPGIETYTIITTTANAQLLPIHDRMPVIVPPERYAQWLDRAQDDSVLLASHGGALKLDR
jgi:putative SOS response-associated peptidase YedK